MLLSFCHSIEANQETLVDYFLKMISLLRYGTRSNSLYFGCLGWYDNCTWHNFCKSVGMIWAAIYILCYFRSELEVSIFVKITQDAYSSAYMILFPLICKSCTPFSHRDHLSIQNIKVLWGPFNFQNPKPESDPNSSTSTSDVKILGLLL